MNKKDDHVYKLKSLKLPNLDLTLTGYSRAADSTGFIIEEKKWILGEFIIFKKKKKKIKNKNKIFL